MTLFERIQAFYDWAKPRIITLYDLTRYMIIHPKFLAGFAMAATVCWVFH